MGAFLEKPNVEKHNEVGAGNNLKYGVGSMQGWRIEMEDAHVATIGLPDLSDWSFFAVFDGHAGSKVAALSASKLLETILEQPEFKSNGIIHSPDTVKTAIRNGFLSLDTFIRSMPEIKSGEDKSGTTAVCCLISPTHIFFGNCGDSRAVFCRGGKPHFNTEDHKPANQREKERIQNAGGSVMIQRVNGALAVSRALGDFEYKNVLHKGQCEQLVSPEPDVTVFERNPTEDQFLILACDGIWDVLNNKDACDYASYKLRTTNNLQLICNSIIDTCLIMGSRDNMSVVLVAFPAAPQVSDDAVAEEAALDADIERRIKEMFDKLDGNMKRPDAAIVLHRLTLEDIPNLPPGGGLCAKRQLIDDLVRKFGGSTPSDDRQGFTLRSTLRPTPLLPANAIDRAFSDESVDDNGEDEAPSTPVKDEKIADDVSLDVAVATTNVEPPSLTTS